MKKLKKPNRSYKLITFSYIFISLVLLTYLPYHLYTAFNIFWIVSATLVILVITPLGGIRIVDPSHKNKQPVVPLINSILFIWLTQICLIAAFAGFYEITTYFFQLYGIALSSQPTSTMTELLMHYGGTPWCILTLLSLAFAYNAYNKRRDTQVSQLCSPLLKKTAPDEKYGIIINYTCRAASFISIATSALIITIIISQWLLSYHHNILHTGLQLPTLYVLGCITLLSTNKRTQKILYKLTPRFHPILILIGYMLLISATIVIVTLLTSSKPLSTASLNAIIPFYLYQANVIWPTAALLWFLPWTILLAPVMVKHCYGKSIRSNILLLLSLPLIILIITILQNNQMIVLPPISHWINNTSLISIYSLLANFFLLSLIFQKKNSGNILQNNIRKDNQPKYRNPLASLKTIILLGFILYAAYFIGGLFFLTWIYLYRGLLISIVILTITLSFLRRLHLDKQQ